jgi:hypothetical protein
MDQNLVLTILAAVLVIAIGFIPSINQLSDPTQAGVKRHWQLITLFILIVCYIVVTFYQYSINKKESGKQQVRIDSIQRASDSVISAGIDTGNARLFRNLSEALAKQQLQLDTVNKKLVDIRNDTSRRKTTIVSGPDPVFLIDSIIQDRDNGRRHHFIVVFHSLLSTSTGFDIMGYTTIRNLQGKLIAAGGGKIFSFNEKVPPGREIIHGFEVDANPSLKQVYVYLKGTYQNTSGKKIPIDDWYLYDKEFKSTKTVTPVARPELDSFFESQSK